MFLPVYGKEFAPNMKPEMLCDPASAGTFQKLRSSELPQAPLPSGFLATQTQRSLLRWLPTCPDWNEKPGHLGSEVLSLPPHTAAFLLTSGGTTARRVTRRNQESGMVA